MFEVTVEATFAAAHFLRDYVGKCQNLHGHNYRVEVMAAGETLDRVGMVVDFVPLKAALREVTERLDHVNLNDTPPFDVLNTTAENIAWYIHGEVQRILGETIRIHQVKVWETDTCAAVYRPK